VADKREFLVVIAGKESVSPAAGKAEDALGDLGDQAKKTERDFDGLDRKMREHADTIAHLRNEIARTGDTKLFGELSRNERDLNKLAGLRKSLVDAAGDAAPEMAVSLSGRLGPLLARMPISGPMGAGLAAAAAAAAPALGATIAGAVLGATGVGGVVGGVVLAAKNERVKSAGTALATDLGKRLERAAEPMVPAVLRALDRAGGGLDDFEARMKRIFARSAGYLDPLARGLGGGGRSLLGGLESALNSAGPAIAVLGSRIKDLGETAGGLFAILSDDGPAAADALNQTLGALNTTLQASAVVVNGLTESYDFLRSNQGLIGDWLNPYIDKQAAAARAQEEATRAAEAQKRALEEQGSAAYSTAQMVDLLTAALDRQVDEALTVAEANLRYRESVQQAADAADGRRGVTLDEERALLGLARSINEATRANDNNSESATTAKRRYEDATAQFVNTAVKMGYTREQAARLSDELLKIPKKVAPQVLVDAGPAIAGARNIQRAINGIKGRTINVHVSGEFGGNDIGAMHGSGRASGGPIHAGQTYLVGEEGPELVTPTANGYVHDAKTTAAMARSVGPLTGAGFGGGVAAFDITIRWPDGSVAGRIVQAGFAGPAGRTALGGLKQAIGNAGGSTRALNI